MTKSKPDNPLWGPWSPDLIDPCERKAQLRSLAAIVYMLRIEGGHDPMSLVRALREAELEVPRLVIPGDVLHPQWPKLYHARHLFDLLPVLHQRRIIATFAAVNYLKMEDNDGKTA